MNFKGESHVTRAPYFSRLLISHLPELTLFSLLTRKEGRKEARKEVRARQKCPLSSGAAGPRGLPVGVAGTYVLQERKGRKEGLKSAQGLKSACCGFVLILIVAAWRSC